MSSRTQIPRQETALGDKSSRHDRPQELRAVTDRHSSPSSRTTQTHLVITGNTALSNPFLGPSGMDVDDNSVGHDLVFSGNTADPGGLLEVANNSVGHDVTCAANSLPLSKDGPDDGPNLAGHANGCG